MKEEYFRTLNLPPSLSNVTLDLKLTRTPINGGIVVAKRTASPGTFDTEMRLRSR
jgi:hypothetical protein|nr:hypothetical protein [Vibrio sp.]